MRANSERLTPPQVAALQASQTFLYNCAVSQNKEKVEG
jgi:hypothetical protein